MTSSGGEANPCPMFTRMGSLADVMRMDASATNRRVYRAVGTTWAAVGGAGGAVIFAAVAWHAGRGQAVTIAAAAVLVLMAWRFWNAGIHVLPEGVKVATVFLSRKVAWEDIDRFAVMPLGRYPYVGYVVLHDGRKFGTFGLSTSARKTEKNRLQIQGLTNALNEALAQWRAANPNAKRLSG